MSPNFWWNLHTHTQNLIWRRKNTNNTIIFRKPSYWRVEWHLAKFCKRYISYYWSNIACLQTECVFATVFENVHRWLRWKVIKSFGHWTAEEPISGANKYPNHGRRSHTREILFFFAPSPINLPKVPRIVFTENYLSQIYVRLYVVWSRGHGAWQGLRIRAGPLVRGPLFCSTTVSAHPFLPIQCFGDKS